jgi:hypothetical protein
MTRIIDFKQILQDEASFQIIRTNPKLTGNVKLTVDSNDKMWLNSIDANEELSKSIYKRVAIDPDVSLPGNMFNFFDSGNTPSEIVFDMSESFDSTKTSTDFKDQYDFDYYFSGVNYLPSRRYTEKLSYFAPIYLKEDVPEYFVIFKIDDPLNHPIDKMEESYPYDKETYIKDLFKKSSIIKTFDLRPTTKVGSFLRAHINNSNFPLSPLSVSFDENIPTDFNGILYNSGVFGSRGENLYDFYQSSNPLKYFEEFVTLGFERNGVIFPNIINLEFIFDDDTSEVYDFNRYIGMYVNAIELSKCDIDLDRGYKERGTWENTPRFRREYFEYENVNIEQSNDSGIVIPITNLDVYLSDFKDIFSDKNNMFFNYFTDRNENIHLPKLDDPYSIDYEGSTELLSGKVRLSDTNLELGDMFGPGKSFIQDKGSPDNDRGFSYAYIKVETLSHLDTFKLYHPHGTNSDANGKYELIEATIGFSETPDPEDFYFFHDIDNINGNDTFYFNAEGSKLENAVALAGCINKIRRGSIRAYVYNEYVFIRCNIAGDYDNDYSLEFISPSLDYSGITITDITGDDLIGTNIKFEGGSRTEGNRLIIDYDYFERINTRIDDILVKTVDGWSKINKISRFIDPINEANINTAVERKNALDLFFGKMSVVLDRASLPKTEEGDFTMVLKHRPAFGLLSFFPIKDFDFDFYSSEYLNFPQVDLYEHYYIPPENKELYIGLTYNIYGSGSILINEIQVDAPTSYQIPISGTGPYSYTVISGDVIVEARGENTLFGADYWNKPIDDKNEELSEFPGFFLLKDPDQVVPESEDDLYLFRDKYLNGIANSEYDFYKENNTKDFALRSKILPYITKWVYPDGLDCRSNPYRLNTELIFGFNNFAPDHEDSSQNPANFTHEWFYIESKFRYSDDESIVSLNNSYFPTPFDLNKALTEDGYFIDYFTYTPEFLGNEVGKTQTRYSPIRKNTLGIYETFFKGFKIQFKDYIDATNINEAGKPEFNPNSNKYDGYKFTTLLKPIKEDINDSTTPPIRYRFIEHSDFKFVILLIEVSIGYRDSIGEYWQQKHLGGLDEDQWNSITNRVTSTSTPPATPPYEGNSAINFLDVVPGTTDKVYDSVNGDYRIQFDTVSGLDISNITHTLLYSLKHKKFNQVEDNFSNVKLSNKFYLNSEFSGGAMVGDFEIDGLSNINIPNYPSSIKEELQMFNPSTFIIAYDSTSDSNSFVDLINGVTPANVSNLISATNDTVTYADPLGSDYGLISDANAFTSYLPVSGLSSTIVSNTYTFKIMTGGELYFETLFEKLAFGKFKELANELDPFIEYETYSYDGSTLTSTTSNWYTEIPDNSNVTKVDAIISQIDSNKPSNLAFNNVIGFTYERSDLDNSYEINRYDGGFVPLFKDVFVFNSKFNFTSNDIAPLDLSNTRFNIDINEFLKLSNFSHIKVSNTKILDLENDEEYEPRYEIANEIAIGRSDYDLFTSNWDFGFHYRYLDKSTKSPVAGTLRIEEDDSFISKIISLRDEIELEQYNVDIVKNIEAVDLNNHEIVYQENDLTISGKINVVNAITSYLINDGISDKFIEFLKVDPSYIGNFETIEDYVKEYINLNITKLYEIIDIEFYSKEDRTLDEKSLMSNQNKIEFRFLNDTQRFDQGYKLTRNTEINKLDRFTLTFEITKAINSGTLVSPKIKIKFI